MGVSADQSSLQQQGLAAGQRGSEGFSPAAPSTLSARAGDRAAPTEYRISPQDIVDVTVYQVPDLNRSVQVDASVACPLKSGPP